MSKTSMALIGKLLMVYVAGLLTLGLIDRNTWWEVLVVAVIAAAINYLLGDLLILPAAGKVWAAVGDGILASILIYLIALLWPELTVSWTSLVAFAVLIMIGEYFFHNYLKESEEVAP